MVPTQVLVPEPVPGEVSDLEVLDQDVAPGGEAPDELLAGRLRQVHRDRLLPAIDREIVGGLLGLAAVSILEPGWPPGPGLVPGPRSLDLDHVGAQVGEVLGRPRAGEDAGEIEDAEVLEGAWHASLPSQHATRGWGRPSRVIPGRAQAHGLAGAGSDGPPGPTPSTSGHTPAGTWATPCGA